MADKDFVVKNGFAVNGSILVVNTSTQSVGVNTTAPDAALKVVGTANVSGNVVLSSNLTISGNTYSAGVVNSSSFTVGSALVGNASGVYTTGVVNASTLSVGTDSRVNTSGVYTTGVVNAATARISSNATVGDVTVNTSSIIVGSALTGSVILANASQLTIGNAVGLSANGSVGAPGEVLSSDGVTVYWSSGFTGFTGSRGANGAIGFTGSVGSLGYTGSIGYTGSKGDVGLSGAAGATGFTGSVGSLGYTGSIGYTGSKGDVGLSGAAGATGFTGSLGYTGSIGYSGSIGVMGLRGDTGFTGSLGFTGSGYTGSRGFTGSQGNTGFTGSLGFTGSGYTGSLGFTGSRGFTGSQGNTGFTGSLGYTGSFIGGLIEGAVLYTQPTLPKAVITSSIFRYSEVSPNTASTYGVLNISNGTILVNSVGLGFGSIEGYANGSPGPASGASVAIAAVTGGYVYISSDLYVFGNAYKSGGGSWSSYSDRRLKKNVVDVNKSLGLNRITRLKPVEYQWDKLDEERGMRPGVHRGFVAQDVQIVYPDSVSNKPIDKDGVNYMTFGFNNDFFADLVAAVQNLADRVTDLETKINRIQGSNTSPGV